MARAGKHQNREQRRSARVALMCQVLSDTRRHNRLMDT